MATQRCQAAILYSDLSALNQLIEKLDPEPVAGILSELRQVTESVVNDHGGIVNQFYGDGVLAAFGYPDSQNNSKKQAIFAALDLHQAVREIKPPADIYIAGFDIQLQSGIDSGLVAVQKGDPIQGRYRLTGDPLNTAAHLSVCANQNQILVSADTVQDLLPLFVTEKEKWLQLKGKSEPVKAYSILDRA